MIDQDRDRRVVAKVRNIVLRKKQIGVPVTFEMWLKAVATIVDFIFVRIEYLRIRILIHCLIFPQKNYRY